MASSSVGERRIVNADAAGSNPASPAIIAVAAGPVGALVHRSRRARRAGRGRWSPRSRPATRAKTDAEPLALAADEVDAGLFQRRRDGAQGAGARIDAIALDHVQGDDGDRRPVGQHGLRPFEQPTSRPDLRAADHYEGIYSILKEKYSFCLTRIARRRRLRWCSARVSRDRIGLASGTGRSVMVIGRGFESRRCRKVP